MLKENRMSEILLAISQPNRIRILNALRKEGMLCGCELLAMLELEQSNLSRHLSTLVKAGILISWKDGVRINYKIADARVNDLLDSVEKIALDKNAVRAAV